MTTPTAHAQLLRQLAEIANSHASLMMPFDGIPNAATRGSLDAATRARKAAEEIEGRRGPTDMTDQPQPRPPLWREMARSYNDSGEEFGYAAEIRAVADEADERFGDYVPAHTVIAWLREEAQRAEAGEQ